MPPSLQTTRGAMELLRRSFWNAGAPLSDAEKIAVLDDIGRIGGSSVVPAFLGLLFAESVPVGAAAAAWIDRIVRAQTSLELTRLDVAVREERDWQWSGAYAPDVQRLAHGLTCTLGAIACHRSGYVREAAVRLLSLTYDGAELPFLLIRSNDWVREVREAAKRALLDRLGRSEYGPHLARHLPLLFRLKDQGRDDHGDVIRPALRVLQGPECRPTLFEVLEGADRQTRRLALGLLLEAGEDLQETVNRAMAIADGVVRLRVGRVSRKRLDGPVLERVLVRMMADRFMPVRREALYGYMERLPASAAAAARAALLDLHPSMRDAARFFLRHRGESDFAEFYRATLDQCEHGRRAAAVAGVGETGNRDDVPRMESCLIDPDPRVRWEAVRALGRLSADDHVEHFLAALEDATAMVAKAARDILRSRIYLVGAQRLWSIFTSTEKSHTRRAVLALIAALPWWESAPILVAATASWHEASKCAALDYLERWRMKADRLTVRPSVDQLSLLEAMLRKHRHRLGQAVLDDLDAHVAYARRELV